MRFQRAINLMQRALQVGGGTSVAQCASSVGLSRGVLPVLFVLQARPQFAGQRLVQAFLLQVREVYNLAEASGFEDETFKGRQKKEEQRFYHANSPVLVQLHNVDLVAAVKGLLLDPQNYSVCDVLRDLEVSPSNARNYIQRIGLDPAQQSQVLARLQTEAAFIRDVEQDLFARLPEPQEEYVQYVHQWISASFSPRDNLFALIGLNTLQPALLYSVAFVCVVKACSDQSTTIPVVLIGVMLAAMAIKAKFKPPEFKQRLRRLLSPEGMPIDVFFWIGYRLVDRYRPNAFGRFVCAVLGLVTVVLILWYALGAFLN